MKKTILLILLSFAAWPAADARSRVITDTLHSEILDADREYVILLPKSYYKETGRQYPVLYLLHGMYGDHLDWNQKANAGLVADNLAAEGTAAEMIIVSPNAGGHDPVTQQNGYFNIDGWRYEDFFFEEFIPFIESTYRISGRREHRAVAGLSMGGGGTVSYAQRHPEMFCAAYAISAWLTITDHHGPDYAKAKGKIGPLNVSVKEHDCIEFVKNAAPETLEQLREIYWFIDCGDDDFLLGCNMDFYMQMCRARVPAQLRVRNGKHDWEYWHSALYKCLEVVSDRFGRL